MNGRTSRVAIFLIVLALGHTSVFSFTAQAAPSNGVSIRAVQNSAGATAIIIVTSKKYAKNSIVVTSSSLQGKSSPKTSIVGSVSVGKNGSAVVTSVFPLPAKSTISVFSASNHLMTVVDIPISIVTTLPKSSQVVATSKSTTMKILKAAANRWRIEYDKTREQIVESVPVFPTALREALDSAVAALNAYAVAGGDIKSQLAVALESAITAKPPVLTDIATATNALREATTRLPVPTDPVALRDALDSAVAALNAYAVAGGDFKNQSAVALKSAITANPLVLTDIATATNALREATTRLPDPIALREAGDYALKSINAYLAAGGSNQNELVVSLLETMKVFPPVIAGITAGADAIRVATTQLPPLVDPRQAAIEEVLRGLVVKAEALIDSYFAAGGSGEDEVALALLRALNANPQNSRDIAEAMNALSFATTQLPTPDNLEDLLGD